MLLSFKLAFEPIRLWKIAIFTYDLQVIWINIKNVKGVHYSWHLDEQFTVCFVTVSQSPQMLLSFKLWHILHLSPFGSDFLFLFFTYDLEFI